ncbi:MAG: FxsA family protein [Allorhizobium sp.]
MRHRKHRGLFLVRYLLGLLVIAILAEIAGFAFVGGAIGVLPTVIVTVLASLTGLILVRIQGAGILRRLASESRDGRVPGRELMHGAMIVIAALLLVVPGFISDFIGLLLFIPFVRDLASSAIARRVVIFQGRSSAYKSPRGPAPAQNPDGPIIDLDDDDFERDPKAGSPWSIGRDPKR